VRIKNAKSAEFPMSVLSGYYRDPRCGYHEAPPSILVGVKADRHSITNHGIPVHDRPAKMRVRSDGYVLE